MEQKQGEMEANITASMNAARLGKIVNIIRGMYTAIRTIRISTNYLEFTFLISYIVSVSVKDYIKGKIVRAQKVAGTKSRANFGAKPRLFVRATFKLLTLPDF